MKNLFKTLLPIFAFVACIVSGNVSAGFTPVSFALSDLSSLDPDTPAYAQPMNVGDTWKDTVGSATSTATVSDIYYATCEAGLDNNTHLVASVVTSDLTATAPGFSVNVRKQSADNASWASAAVSVVGTPYTGTVLADNTFVGLYGTGYKLAQVELQASQLAVYDNHWRIIVTKLAGDLGAVNYRLNVSCWNSVIGWARVRYPVFNAAGVASVVQIQDR
jgi:hypothetical protein